MNLRRLALTLALLACSAQLHAKSTSAPDVPPASVHSYEALFAEAERNENEGSWAKARDSFAAALALAPQDSDSRRWCELRLIAAQLKADEAPDDWSVRKSWLKKRHTIFDPLLIQYEHGERPRDDFWAATLRARAALRLEDHNGDEAWPDYAELSEYLTSLPPTPESAARFVEFLKFTCPGAPGLYSENFNTYVAWWELAARTAPDSDERAWCALYAAMLQFPLASGGPATYGGPAGALPPEARQRYWDTVVRLAEATKWAPLARARAFAWRALDGYSPVSPQHFPANLSRLLGELRAVRNALQKSAPAAADKATLAVLVELEKQWTTPILRLQMAASIPSGEEQVFSFGAAGIDQLTVEVFQHSPALWAERQLNLADLWWHRDDPNFMVPNDPAARVRQWTIPLAAADKLGWHTEQVTVKPLLEAGFYTLVVCGRATNGSPIAQADFMVTTIGAVLFSANSNDSPSELFLFNAADGRPLTEIEVEGISSTSSGTRNSRPAQAIAWRGRTDSAGRIELPGTPAFDRFSAPRSIMAAVATGQPIAISASNRSASKPNPLSVDLLLDRPMYRPGDTVHWKAIARLRSNGKFTIPTGTLRIGSSINRYDESLVEDTDFSLNESGTAHGEFIIPASCRPGEAGFSVELINANIEQAGNKAWMSDAFRVDNFLPPAIEVGLELPPGADSLRPGREIILRAHVGYFSGGPTAGAPVECRLESSLSSAGVEALPPLEGAAVAAWCKSIAGEALGAVTDTEGNADFRVRLPAELPSYSELTARLRVLPRGGQPVQLDEKMAITSAGLTLDPGKWTNWQAAHPGERIPLTCTVRDGRGQPAAFSGEVRLIERRWMESWSTPDNRVVSGLTMQAELFREGWKPGQQLPDGWINLHAQYHETVVSKESVQSGADGIVATNAVPPHAGVFQLRLFNGDMQLPLASGALEDNALGMLVAGTEDDLLGLPPSESVVAGPAVWRTGDPLTFLVVLPSGIDSGWLTLENEGRPVVQRFTVPAGRRTAWIKCAAAPSFAGIGAANLRTISLRYSVSSTCSFTVEDPSTDLRILIDTPTVLPTGAKAPFALRVTDSSGAPRRAECAVTIFDEALTRLDGNPRPLATAFGTYESVNSVRSDLSPMPANARPDRFRDPRPGASLNPSVSVARPANGAEFRLAGSGYGGGGYGGPAYFGTADESGYSSDEDVIVLSPFCIEAEASVGDAAENARRNGDHHALAAIRQQLGDAPAAMTIRRHFSSTAAWVPELKTGPDGSATIECQYPDNLTQWRIEAYAVGADGHSSGRATALSRTTLPLQARLQLPRFLVVGDMADVSAALVNRADSALSAQVDLQISGSASKQLGTPLPALIPAQGEARVGWSVQADTPGEALFTLSARAGTETDAMALQLPVIEDGLLQKFAASGRLAPEAKKASLVLRLPDPLDRQRTELSVRVDAGPATAVLDALPYLVDYPYGCVEQTMSRFLPAVIVKKTLTDLGLDAAQIEQRAFGHEQPEQTRRREQSAGIGRLDEVVQRSLARLTDARADRRGGFGWWPGAPKPDLWMTAYVVWGLTAAKKAGVELPEALTEDLDQALSSLVSDAAAGEDLAWAVGVAGDSAHSAGTTIDDPNWTKAFERTFEARSSLSASGRACLLLASARGLGNPEQRAVLLRTIDNGARRVHESGLGDTVNWGRTGDYWNSMDSQVESTALTLMALLAADPKHPLIEPAVNWLALNRRSSAWENTRHTAFAILALSRYLKQTSTLAGSGEVEVLVNGQPAGRIHLAPEDLLKNASAIVVPPALLRAGNNTIQLRRLSGQAPCWLVASATSWARGDAVRPTGHLATITRGLQRQAAQPTLRGTVRLTPKALPDRGEAIAGEQVDACITLTVPQALDYVMIEVPKPAGCEPLNPLSGWDAQLQRASKPPPKAEHQAVLADEIIEGRAIFREETDRSSVFFLDHIDAGTWELRFGLRATTPGSYRMLPAQISAMYVPEITANSDARRVIIRSKTP